LQEYTEVESGARNDRPQLQAALQHAKLTGARLVIAKLDRLSRNAAFLHNLMDSGVKFVCVDMPHATELTISIMASLAQHERKMISQRTKEALAEAKRRGVKLGNPNGARCLQGHHAAKAVEVRRAKAVQHAQGVAPVLREIVAAGHTSLEAQAIELNRREIQ